jgi:gluconolactonase
MKKLISVLAIATSMVSVGCANETKVTQAVAKQKITDLKTPESVVQAKDGNIYISEIGDFDKDGDGQITVIDANGKVSVFAKGLDDPKGLAIIGEHLYVADKAKVLKIDLSDAKTSVFVAATAFQSPPQFLNDLEADPQGNLYVTDTGNMGTGKGGIIYKIDANGQVKLLIDGKQDARVMAPNGLLADDTGDVLIYVDFTSGVLYTYNQKTQALTDIAEGFGGGDGIVHHSNGTMYVSDWKNGKVFSLNTKGDVILLKDGYQSAADIAITKDEAYLMVPDMKAGELDFIPLNNQQ